MSVTMVIRCAVYYMKLITNLFVNFTVIIDGKGNNIFVLTNAVINVTMVTTMVGCQ